MPGLYIPVTLGVSLFVEQSVSLPSTAIIIIITIIMIRTHVK